MVSVKIKYINDATYYDVDDYVIGTLHVPFVTRDMTYALDTEGGTIELSGAYNFEGYSLDDIESVKISEGSNYFHGVKVSTADNKMSTSYSVTFFKNIHLLKTKKINRDSLEAIITNTSDTRLYNPDDVNGWRAVSFMWFIKNLFEDVGLQDPTLTLAPKIAVKSKTAYTNILFSELKIDLDIMYCVNQQVAVRSDSTISDMYDKNKEITYFELIDMFCKLFGVVLRNDANGYYLDIKDEYRYTISDDYLIDYNKNYYEKELFTKEINFGFQFKDDVYAYTSNSESSLNTGWYSNIKNKATQNWYDNLIIGYEDRNNLGSLYKLNNFIDYITTNDEGYYSYIGAHLRNKKEKSYIKETIKTKVLESIIYGNVLRFENVYGLGTYESNIEQMEIL